jgi:eukaryotic-like serine/threonine-protein kinase
VNRSGDGQGAIAIVESAALLVAGSDPEQPERVRNLIRAIGQLDQTLRSTRSRWAIRRLSAASDERIAPTRVGIKHMLEAITREPAQIVIVVIAGTMTGTATGERTGTATGAMIHAAREPALITGAMYRRYPDEATLPLAWIGQRLAAMSSPHVLVLVSARPDDAAPPVDVWLAALAPPGTGHAVFVDGSERAVGVDALCQGLRGGAVDADTGTVTVRSIADYLARVVPQIETRAERWPQTILRPASLGDMRALGWSRSVGAGTAAASGADDLSGAVLRGEIRVDEVLARGGFGVVYRARQLWMRRDVALKVLPPGVDAQSEDGQLFLDEIRAVARIDHPNVVRIFHADETYDGRLFYAMELLTGEDFDQLADRGPMPPSRAVALVGQLLVGLAAAHDAGLIHADIKPGNGFVARGGAGDRVVLLDFGLARLARPGAATASVGGTPQYMAPEQLAHQRVDERSDLFSVGLVLFTLLTGWRRQRASEIVPSLDLIADGPLRAVLARVLAVDPAARYSRAADFAAALGELAIAREGGTTSAQMSLAADRGAGGAVLDELEPLQPPPFRRLRSFSERDRDRFFGRDREVAQLLDHVLQLPAVIYTAPSGVGKTSLLRAGLLPRIEALGGHGSYVACHGGPGDRSAVNLAVLEGDASSPAVARTLPAHRPRGRHVIVLDQIETMLADGESADGESADGESADGESADGESTRGKSARGTSPIDTILRALLTRGAAELDQTVVLSVREDFLGRLVDRLQPYAPNLPILRLPPLSAAGARDALVRPLAARRLTIDGELLAQLVADLAASAASLGAEMGWGAAQAVYPPHLQLAGARLHETLADDASVLTLQQYRQLGGIDEIVRSHLTHVLESELARDQVLIARELFKHLITPALTRAAPTEAQLIAAIPDPTRATAATAVLEALRQHGLIVRLARGHREASWELIHDSLIPRIQAWMDNHDLERRRALEMLRHHARQSRPGAPSLLTASELRALRAAPDVVAVVEREWRDRVAATASADPPPWTPTSLVAHARAIHRRRRLAIGATLAITAAGVAAAGGTWWRSRQAQQRVQAQIAANLGRFQLELAPYDWDAERLTARGVPIADLPQLHWELRDPDPSDLDIPGAVMRDDRTVQSSVVSPDGLIRVDAIEAPGRAAFLVIDHRGRDAVSCAPSVIPIRMLPGYALREQRPDIRIPFPTCQASAAGTIEIPAGPYHAGGVGDPPSAHAKSIKGLPPDVEKYMPRYWIDRTEVTNAAFEPFNAMSRITGIAPPAYPDVVGLRDAGKPNYPVGGMPSQVAWAYCRYMGKSLQTSDQWEKALRGGLTLAGGARNPYPARNFPWGAPRVGAIAKLKDVPPIGPAPVGTFPDDVSPDGVYDLAGNMSEWTNSLPVLPGNESFRVFRGGNWSDTTYADLVDFMPIQNTRWKNNTDYATGFRCATNVPSGSISESRSAPDSRSTSASR